MVKGATTFVEEYSLWTEDILQQFYCEAVPIHYQKGTTILHPAKESQSLFLVQSGVVSYRYFTKSGNALTVLQMRSGDMFGLKAIFNHDHEKDFYVVTATDVQLWKISRDSFLDLMKSDFEFTKYVIQYFVQFIGNIERKMMSSAVLSNYQRFVLLLLDCAEEIKNNTAIVQMTQQDMADLLTTSRQSVSTYLSKMNELGLISVKRGRIVILNWNALNQELL